MNTQQIYLTDVELAKRWGAKPSMLRARRIRGEAPSYFKLGRLVRYSLAVIEAFESSNAIDVSN